MYSHVLVIRWRSSGKSRSQQEIKAISPSTLWWLCAVLISVIFCSSMADGWHDYYYYYYYYHYHHHYYYYHRRRRHRWWWWVVVVVVAAEWNSKHVYYFTYVFTVCHRRRQDLIIWPSFHPKLLVSANGTTKMSVGFKIHNFTAAGAQQSAINALYSPKTAISECSFATL